jgi:hypothetical protein
MNTKREVDVSQFAGHTPGPWVICGAPDLTTVNDSIRQDETGELVCEFPYGADDNQGNSYLIAAAPDLLAEMIELRAQLTAVTAERDEARHERTSWADECVKRGDRIAELEAKCAAMEKLLTTCRRLIHRDDKLARSQFDALFDAAIAREKEGK